MKNPYEDFAKFFSRIHNANPIFKFTKADNATINKKLQYLEAKVEAISANLSIADSLKNSMDVFDSLQPALKSVARVYALKSFIILIFKDVIKLDESKF